MTHVAEIVTFRLAEGVSPERFVALSQASETFVRAQPGFLHRQLSQGEDGLWTDYVIWADMDAAKQAAAKFPAQEFAGPLIAAIDPQDMGMRHETVLWDMAS